jgi:methylenetetrahydrofolate--tRNA-(uracil-5-)-methyltransferase
MRPTQTTPAHTTADLAEIVCSNSLGSDEVGTAPALLKEELRALGSELIRVADSVRVPAGKALAVDRAQFSRRVTEVVSAHPLIEIIRDEVTRIPEAPAILATGPLTSPALASQVQEFTGRQNLYFYDASSPIVLAESVDLTKAFRASRYGRGSDYLNCPLERDEYLALRDALHTGEKAAVHEFDKLIFFEGCLPIEELAARGEDTMRFGPLKPVGLVDPRSGRQPYAVIQLRQDDLAAEHYNMVGFQSRLKWGEQKRIFTMIPGLEQAEFVSFGKVHRNSYINSPAILGKSFETLKRPGLHIVGTLAGVEGYTECIASGLIAARQLAARLCDGDFELPPPTTALGALCRYLEQADWKHFHPVNFSFGLLEPIEKHIRNKEARRLALVERARAHFEQWMAGTAVAP